MSISPVRSDLCRFLCIYRNCSMISGTHDRQGLTTICQNTVYCRTNGQNCIKLNTCNKMPIVQQQALFGFYISTAFTLGTVLWNRYGPCSHCTGRSHSKREIWALSVNSVRTPYRDQFQRLVVPPSRHVRATSRIR